MSSKKFHELSKCRPAIIVTIMHADEDVCSMLYAVREQCFVEVNNDIRIQVIVSRSEPIGGAYKAFVIGASQVPELFNLRSQLKRVAVEWQISIMVSVASFNPCRSPRTV